jgi:phage FluMu protein Com
VPVKAMREVASDEIPPGGGTAVQEDPARPVFRGGGAFDYPCVHCGTVLAASMDPQYMTFRVRIRCATCRTVNVVAVDESVDPRKARKP